MKTHFIGVLKCSGRKTITTTTTTLADHNWGTLTGAQAHLSHGQTRLARQASLETKVAAAADDDDASAFPEAAASQLLTDQGRTQCGMIQPRVLELQQMH